MAAPLAHFLSETDRRQAGPRSLDKHAPTINELGLNAHTTEEAANNGGMVSATPSGIEFAVVHEWRHPEKTVQVPLELGVCQDPKRLVRCPTHPSSYLSSVRPFRLRQCTKELVHLLENAVCGCVSKMLLKPRNLHQRGCLIPRSQD